MSEARAVTEAVAAPEAPAPTAPSTSAVAATPVEDAALELTIVLPCLNEAETLAVVIDKAMGSLRELQVRGEVVVADNGSTDGSQQIAKDHGARVVDVPRRGYGAALQAGIAAARGRFVIMADADDSYALDRIGPFVEALRGGAELVMGNRFAGGIGPGAMPFLHKYLGNPVLSWMGRLFFRVPINDFHCGIRGFRKDSIDRLDLRTTGMEFASEMVVRASLARLRIVEVPTTLQKDGRSRPPHLRTWRDGWRHLKFLLAFSPRWLFLYPAALLATVGLLGMLVLAWGPVTLGDVSFDVQSFVVATTALIVGVQIGGLSLVARAYATAMGLLPHSPRLERLLERIALERGLVLGGTTVAAGVATFVAAVVRWGEQSFGAMPPQGVRLPIIGLALVVTGAQVVMVSFALSLAAFRE